MKKVLSVTLAVLLLTSIVSFAQPMKGKNFLGHQRNMKALLKLTPEQEKQFDDITYKQKEEAIDIRAKMQKNRLELGKLISDKNIDESKILQLTDENSKLQADLKRGHIKSWIAIYKTLTDDQKSIFVKRMGRFAEDGPMMPMMNGKMGRGFGNHNMPDRTDNKK